MAVYRLNQKFRAAPTAPASRPPSDRRVRLAEMFGIGLDEAAEVTVYEGLALDVRPGDVVFITGPSGSGKSVLLRALARAMRDDRPDGGRASPRRNRSALPRGGPPGPPRPSRRPGKAATRVVDLAHLPVPADRPVIDLPAAPFEQALRLLSAAGLADAFALLRPAAELSDGQRYRLRLALALDRLLDGDWADPATPGHSPAVSRSLRLGASSGGVSVRAGEDLRDRRSRLTAGRGSRPAALFARILLADEFCSTLDRCCARAVAWRLRRLVDRHGLTLLAASAHDDLVQDLAPDVLVAQHEGQGVAVRYADPERGAGGATSPERNRGDRSLTVAASEGRANAAGEGTP